MLTQQTLQSFTDEIEKIASRSYLKDFAAGADPMGTWTSGYGTVDAGISDQDALARRTVATAGGVLGGSLLVPGAITGAVEGAKGFASGGLKGALRGAAFGFHKYPSSIYQGRRASNLLSKVIEGVDLTAQEATQLGEFGQKVLGSSRFSPKVEEVLRNYPAQAGKLLKQVPSQHLNTVKNYIDAGVTEAGATLGISGVLGGGAAHIGYSKGRETGQIMTPEQRARANPGVVAGGNVISGQ